METWVQFVVGPVSLLVVGWILDRRVRRVDKKADGAAEAASTAAQKASEVRRVMDTAAADVSEVKEHVVNTHTTNLRHDIDDLRDIVSDVADAVRDMRTAQDRRHEDFRDFRGEMLDFRAATNANHGAIHRRMDVLTERFDRHIDRPRPRRPKK